MNIRQKVPAAKLELLRKVPGLKHVSNRQWAELDRLVDEIEVAKGTVLMTEGARGHEAFVIVEGWARVTVRGERVAVVGPGQFVGETAMLDHGPRTATVTANTRMRLLAIGRQTFGSFAHHPDVARSMTRELAERLRNTDACIAPQARHADPVTSPS